MLWVDNSSTCGGIASVLWGIVSVLWRLFSTVGDNISTVEGTRYSGGTFLILACSVIKNYEKISIVFLYHETKFSFGSLENSSRFHGFIELNWCT